MKSKKSELTIETVAIFLLALIVVVVAIFLILRNRGIMDKLTMIFRGMI
jgi:hypothetical protein